MERMSTLLIIFRKESKKTKLSKMFWFLFIPRDGGKLAKKYNRSSEKWSEVLRSSRRNQSRTAEHLLRFCRSSLLATTISIASLREHSLDVAFDKVIGEGAIELNRCFWKEYIDAFSDSYWNEGIIWMEYSLMHFSQKSPKGEDTLLTLSRLFDKRVKIRLTRLFHNSCIQ